MRFYLTSWMAAGLVASLATSACATPTKAETFERHLAEAHGKAGLVQSSSLAADLSAAFAVSPISLIKPVVMPKPALTTVAKNRLQTKLGQVSKSVRTAASTAKTRVAEQFAIKELSPTVNFVTVLPGQRFPLRAVAASGDPLTTKWRATGGTLAFGDHMAVWQAPLQPGVHRVIGYAMVQGRMVKRMLTMIVSVPTANVRNGKLNGYPIGTYPRGFLQPPAQIANRGARDTYIVPSGFIELNSANVDAPLSEHYRLGDFAGKDDWVNGRKYLFLEPRLVEKLERIIFTLHGEGYKADKIELLSAYRSPILNSDIGNHTTLSRHTYGDAADMIVGDYNGDGRVDKTDANILMAAVTKIDKETNLTGGASLYRPNGAHGFFIHTDTRGSLVRW